MRTYALFVLLCTLCLVIGCSPTMRGSVALSQGHYGEALARYHEALAQEPDSIYLRQRIGLTYFAMGDYARAEGSFHNILLIVPGEPNAAFYLGLSRIGKGEREAGLALLQAFRWPDKFYQQKYVQEEALRLKNHPEAPAKEAIRNLQEALEAGIQEQRKLELEMGFITK